MTFKTIQSDLIYQGKVFSIRQDQVELSNGKTMKVDIVQHHGAVVILPVDEDKNIWFVRQYRHPAGEHLLELPAGTLNPGEAPLDCAHREIREEIGMTAEQILPIGEFYDAPGYSTEYLYIYLATKLTSAPLPPDEDEIIDVVKIPIKQAYELALQGQLRDAKTLASLLLAQPYLLEQKQ
ncbi:MAG: NUDIX hydrolase [Anaerolineales bacterium]